MYYNSKNAQCQKQNQEQNKIQRRKVTTHYSGLEPARAVRRFLITRPAHSTNVMPSWLNSCIQYSCTPQKLIKITNARRQSIYSTVRLWFSRSSRSLSPVDYDWYAYLVQHTDQRDSTSLHTFMAGGGRSITHLTRLTDYTCTERRRSQTPWITPCFGPRYVQY
jgi:hypothetical protein